jgi:hypothetical protein
MSFNVFTQTLSVSSISANGSALTNLNAGNIMTGTLALTRGGTGATTQAQASLNILPTASTNQYLKFDGTNWVSDTIIHYNDADARDVISVSAGENMIWNSVTKHLDVDLPITWNSPNLGIHNTSPSYPLDVIGTIRGDEKIILGDVNSASTNDGSVEIHQKTSTFNRKMKIGYTSDEFMTIADLGDATTSANTEIVRIHHNAPYQSLQVGSDGKVRLRSTNVAVLNLTGRWYNNNNNNRYTTRNHYLSLRTIRGINIENGHSLLLTSSRKIKKDETDLDDNECLNICLGLKPKKYRMIDNRQHGDDFRYGFIAEEVEEVLPSAVAIGEELLIPNIFENAMIINNDTIEINKSLELDVEYTIYNNNLETDKEKEYNLKVLEDLGNNRYRVDLDLSQMSNDSIFIYGKEEAIPQLKKDHFLPVLTSSVQELHKIITKQQEQIDKLMEILQRNGIN